MVAILKPLCASDLAALNVNALSGSGGVSREEIHAALGNPAHEHAVRAFSQRVRNRGVPLEISYATTAGSTPVYRYKLAGAVAPAVAIAPRSVTRIVTDVLGLGATPGARVSVAYVSCLDAPAARAAGGEGA